MFHLAVEGNFRFHLTSLRKRMQPEGSDWVEYSLPEKITFEETVSAGLKGANIEITQPGMLLYLRPKIQGDKGSITVGLFCDLLSGGLGLEPCYYVHSITVLQLDSKDKQLGTECNRTWVLPCAISSFTNTFDGDDLRFVS